MTQDPSQTKTVQLYRDRVGPVIGTNGTTKRNLEESLNVDLTVDSSTGRVLIKNEGNEIDKFIAATDVIKAINLGFSPRRAQRLYQEGQTLHILDLRAMGFKDTKSLKRIKGRIIGEDGKTREIIEETAKVYLSVYRHYVAIIGDFEGLLTAKEAVDKLIQGTPHKAVYNFVFEERQRQKFSEMKMY
jgi:ribosomal RNA assembly protein